MKSGKRVLIFGVVFLVLFFVWTVLIQTVDVRDVGVNSTKVGFSTLNTWFFEFTGVNFTLYSLTDWRGLVPLAVCVMFGVAGFVQLIKRRSFLKVDRDILVLGVYYVVVISAYLLFEEVIINYRPVLIGGHMESSYPSSTTLLVLSVMPTLSEQLNRRLDNIALKRFVNVFVVMFSVFMVGARLVCGVHWLTDIIGSVLLCMGLFCIYKGVITLTLKNNN